MRKKKRHNIKENIKNVVLYLRYSDNKQTENSIEGQRKKCEEYAHAHNYNIVNEYVDRAKSGRTDNRYYFKKMIDDSEKGQFDAVLVYALSRFGRDIYQILSNESRLENNGVCLLSVTEETENTPAGRMARHMHMAFAEYYSDELAEKVERGLQNKAAKGIFLGGPRPLGYKIVNQKYVVDEAEAVIVKEIFQKYAEGWSYQQLCDEFNGRHITTSMGKQFNKNSFHVLLKNRRYLGIYIYDKIEIPGAIPQIIDEKLFNEVAEKMKLNKLAPGRNRAKAEYLLTQKMFCGHCGEMMIGHSSNQVSTKGVIYNYYRCKNAGGSRPCKKKMISKDYIESLVVNECKKYLTEENIKRIASEMLTIAQNSESTKHIRYYQSAIDQRKRDIQGLMNALKICDDDSTRKDIFSEIRQIKEEIQEIEKDLALAEAKCFIVTEEQIVTRLMKLADGDITNQVYRRALIRVFVNKILIYDDRITITFKTGDDEVTITRELLDIIEEGLGNETLCLSDQAGHHMKQIRTVSFIETGSDLLFSASIHIEQKGKADQALPFSCSCCHLANSALPSSDSQ